MGEDELSAFTAFYAASKDRCLRAVTAYGLRPEAAEDAVAEAFARAWSRWRQVRELQAPAAWVVRTAVNADISWWRRLRREAPYDDPGDAGDLPAPAGAPEDVVDLLDAIRLLPARQRDVVVLRYLLDLDTAATAAWLEIAPGTVTATLHRALGTLRQHLDTRVDTRVGTKERSLP